MPDESLKVKPISQETTQWQEFMIKEQQETPHRLETVGKSLSGMISVTLSIILVFSANILKTNTIPVYVLVIWIIALFLSFLVIFPFPYRYNTQSPQTYKEAHKRITVVKYTILILSVIAYLIAVSWLAIELFG